MQQAMSGLVGQGRPNTILTDLAFGDERLRNCHAHDTPVGAEGGETQNSRVGCLVLEKLDFATTRRRASNPTQAT